MELSEKAAEARREYTREYMRNYMKEYRKREGWKEKKRIYQARYWEKKAREMEEREKNEA